MTVLVDPDNRSRPRLLARNCKPALLLVYLRFAIDFAVKTRYPEP
nr:hypothetical protein JVH1_3887 [Rhodococcus sp. JVH1]